MKHIALSVCLLLAVAATTAGGEPDTTLHFRIEAGVRPGHVVEGRIEESKGAGLGYDRVVLDLDGDGTCETVQPAATAEDYRTKKPYPKPSVTIEREGAKWVLDLYNLGRSRQKAQDGKLVTFAHWSVTSGDLYAWFINGRVTLYTDAATAKAEKALRLGPPFTFDTGATQRGPDALVRVGLKDPNGFTMRLARVDKAQRQIRVQLTSGEKQVVDTHAAYG